MEASSPKRRRVSPTEEPDHQEDPVAKQQRPSFASPTKASMERYNPEILRSRGSSPKRRQVPESAPAPARGASLPTQRKLFPASKPSTNVDDSLVQNVKGTGLGTNANTSDLMSGANAAASDAAADPSPFGGEATESTPTKKTPFIPAPKPSPRPLPPPGPEEDFLEPLARNRRRHRSGLFPELVVPEPEPELPPTPEHPDPVVSTPPSGIHNTPSRRLKRQRPVLEKSSPLKKQSTRAEYGTAPAPSIPGTVPTTTAALRGIKRAVPKLDEDKHLKLLKTKNRELKSQLSKLAAYNQQARDGRLGPEEATVPSNILDILTHAMPEARDETQKPSPWDTAAWDISQLLPFGKTGSTIPSVFPQQVDEPEKPPISHRPLPFTADTRGFMKSFSNLALKTRTEALPKTISEAPLRQKQYIQADSAHAPRISLFSVAVIVNTQSQRVEEIEVPQIHPAAAAETQDFIHALIKPGRDTSRATRHNIGVMGIAMGEWLRVASARANTWRVLREELATKAGLEGLVERIQERKNPIEEDSVEDIDESIQEDGHWPEAAEIEAEWPEDEGINVESPEHLGQAHARERKGGTGLAETEADPEIPGDESVVLNASEDEEADLHDDTLELGGNGTTKNRGQLLPYLGQTSLDFSIPRFDGDSDNASHAQLRVQWKIGFKSTGYAVSDIKVLIGAPAKWHATDTRGRISGIPSMFDKLIAAGEEPIDAVRTVAALLAGEFSS